MHPFLIKQNIHYRIYIVEPVSNLTFNRAMLMNIGFVESTDQWVKDENKFAINFHKSFFVSY